MSRCKHHGNVKVFEHGSQGALWMYAGGASRGARPNQDGVVLDLADATYKPINVYGPIAFPKVSEYCPYTVIRLDWPDMGVPGVGRGFWDVLVERLLELETQGTVDMLVMCQGGHGRTGTALAILGCLLGVIPEGADPVVWVREHYCLEAVETSKQISYIEKITERKVKATASSGWGQYGGTYGAWEGWDD